MLGRIAKYIESYDVYSFMDAYENIDECVRELATLSPTELLEQLSEMNDGTQEYQAIIKELKEVC